MLFVKNNFNNNKGKGPSGYKPSKHDPKHDSGRSSRVQGKDKYLPRTQHNQKTDENGQNREEQKKNELKFNVDQIKFREVLGSLNGSSKANLLNDKGTMLKSVSVRDLTETLKKPPKDTSTVIFDGTVSQRLVDIAASNNIKKLVGMKLGNVTKQPNDIDIILKNDLEPQL